MGSLCAFISANCCSRYFLSSALALSRFLCAVMFPLSSTKITGIVSLSLMISSKKLMSVFSLELMSCLVALAHNNTFFSSSVANFCTNLLVYQRLYAPMHKAIINSNLFHLIFCSYTPIDINQIYDDICNLKP